MLNIGITSGIQTMLKMSVTLKGDSQFIYLFIFIFFLLDKLELY